MNTTARPFSITRDPQALTRYVHVASDRAGSKCTLSVQRPGVVKVTCAGDQHILIDHTPVLIDAEMHLLAGEVKVMRSTVTFRFGRGDAKPTEIYAYGVVERVASMVAQFASELPQIVGEIPVHDDADVADAEALTELNRKQREVRGRHESVLRQIAELEARADAAQVELRELDAAAEELRSSVEARLAARRTSEVAEELQRMLADPTVYYRRLLDSPTVDIDDDVAMANLAVHQQVTQALAYVLPSELAHVEIGRIFGKIATNLDVASQQVLMAIPGTGDLWKAKIW